VLGPVPDGIEVSRRKGAGKQVFLLINFKQETQRITLPHRMKAVLGGMDESSVELPPYGVEVLLDKE
jgi:hypothetical protein